MNVGFERLRTLVMVHRVGSLAAAARELGVTPSAVSQQLTSLEREIGGEVLDRRGRRVELTALGEILVDGGRRVLAELERTSSGAERFLAAAGGPYAIAALPSVALAIVTTAVGRLAQAEPGLDVTVIDAEAGESTELLADRAIDLALVDAYPDLTPPVADGIVATVIGSEPLLLLVPDALAGDGRAVALKRFADQPWVLAPGSAGCGAAARSACRQAGFDPLVRWESNDLMVLGECVAAGLGVTMLPRLALGRPPAGTAVLRLRERSVRRTIVALTRAASAERPQQQLVLAALQAAARDRLEPVPGQAAVRAASLAGVGR